MMMMDADDGVFHYMIISFMSDDDADGSSI